jgi:hypothetical protein
MATFNFNTAGVQPMQPRSYDPLPAGEYELIITKSDVKPTKAGTGHYIELEMQVISGEHSGRRHWERLNVDNPNKDAEEIAKAALAGLCLAVGQSDINDTADLHDIPFIASIEIDRKDPTRNRIMGYSSAGVPTPAAKPAAPAAAGPAKKPWE